MKPVRINRLHAVYPNQVKELKRVLMDEPGGWLEVVTQDGNTYQTELANRPDPKCPVDPEQLCVHLAEQTGIQPTKV